ncbi:ribonucleotide-diphosphate reductase subunit beta [Campylobacter coli]
MNVLYNNEYIDFTKEPLFFGTGKNSQRYDVIKYPIFETLFKKMAGFDWQEDEVQCTKDQTDFNVLNEAMKHSYTRVLNKLIFLDSIQGRGLLQTIGSIVTNPELEVCMTEWQRFEISRHSRSYTHILRSVYANPSKIFDESFEIPELLELADSISKPYEEAFEAVTKYHLNLIDIEEVKVKVLNMLVEINILEGVRFYSGFATIWSMHYSQGLMERTGKILQLICRDENLHLAITQNLIKILSRSPEEGFINAWNSIKDNITDRYLEAADQEFKWIDYLFSKGAFLGMTPELAKNYIKYLINKRLKAVGFKEVFTGFNKNPIPWVETYINYDKNEVLPQESEITNYKMDILDTEIKDSAFERLKKKLKI